MVREENCEGNREKERRSLHRWKRSVGSLYQEVFSEDVFEDDQEGGGEIGAGNWELGTGNWELGTRSWDIGARNWGAGWLVDHEAGGEAGPEWFALGDY